MTSPEGSTSEGRGVASTVFALGVAQTLSWASSYYLPAILARPMAAEFGLAPSAIFAWFSAALVLTALLGPWAGKVIDRSGGRGVLTLSNLVFAAGLATLGLAPGPLVMGLGWGLMGIGMALGLYDAAFATLAGLYGRAAKGPITGVTLYAGFASTLAFPASSFLEAEIGWRGACLCWALAHLLIGLPLHRFLVPPAPPPQPPEPVTAAPPPAHAMLLLAFIFAATSCITGAIAAHHPTLLTSMGATPEMALLAASLTGPAQVAARLAQFGLLRDLHALWVARLACLSQCLGVLLLMAFGGPVALLFALMIGTGIGLHTITRGTLPLAVFGPGGYGARQGLLATPARLLQAAAPFCFGLALEAWGGGVLWLILGLAGAALLALFGLRARPEAA